MRCVPGHVYRSLLHIYEKVTDISFLKKGLRTDNNTDSTFHMTPDLDLGK
jgi:hypothetical protein